MRKNSFPTQERVHELFDYRTRECIGMSELYFRDELIWKKGRGTAATGSEAGYYVPKRNHRAVVVDGKTYDVRQIVWIWHYGSIPEGGIVSINGDLADYKISNLRPRRVPAVSFL